MTQYCSNLAPFSPDMLISSTDDLVVQESDSSLAPWKLTLIIVLPALFVFTVAIVVFCICCKKDMKDMRGDTKNNDNEQ